MHKTQQVWVLLLGLVMLVSACSRNAQPQGFEEGHEWIVPRPAAEVRLRLVNPADQPVSGATAWVVQGETRLTDAGRFVDYDPAAGVSSDADGWLVLKYLGEQGGGYERPLDSSTPPGMFLEVRASGYQTVLFDLDSRLFLLNYRVGESELDYQGEMVKLIVVQDTLTLTVK